MGEERNLRRQAEHIPSPSSAGSKCFAPSMVDEQDGESTITYPSLEFEQEDRSTALNGY